MPAVFRVCLAAEKKPLLGAPVFDLALFFDPFHSRVSGFVDIHRSVTPPGDEHRVQVTGTYHPLIGGKGHIVSLSGHFAVQCPPPATCIIEEHFFATLILDEKWNGKSNFHWGKMMDMEVPVTSVPCK